VTARRITIGVLIAVLALVTFAPLLRSGLTTTDDLLIALGQREGSQLPWLYNAQITGRLGHALTGWLNTLAYAGGHYWPSKVLSLLMLLGSMGAMCVAVQAIAADRALTLLAATLFFAFVQNNWEHNLLTSFPVVLPLALTCFWLAVAAWSVTLQGRRRWRWLSTALFTLTFPVYEIFLVYTIVFPLMSLATAAGPIRARLMAAVRTPHPYAALVYVAAAALFRVTMQTSGGREMMAVELYTVNASPLDMAQVLWQYAISSLPLYFYRAYRHIFYDIYQGFGGFRGQVTDLFEVVEPAWIVKALIVGYLAAVLLQRRGDVQRRGTLLMIGFVVFWLTNLPLSVASKYQLWVQNGSEAYLTAYPVFLGAVLLFVLAGDGLMRVWGRGRRAVRVTAISLGVVAGIIAWGVQFANAHVAFAQQRMFYKWAAVDVWMAGPSFAALPDGSVVLAPTLFEGNDAGTHVYSDYWTRYVRAHSGKRVDVIHARAPWEAAARTGHREDRLYYLKFAQEPRRLSLVLVFGRVHDLDAPLAARDVDVLTRSRAPEVQLFGRVMDVQGTATVSIDGRIVASEVRELFVASTAVAAEGRTAGATPRGWRWTRVSANGGALDPMSIFVSEYPPDGGAEGTARR
jgi:hypothetical protein